MTSSRNRTVEIKSYSKLLTLRKVFLMEKQVALHLSPCGGPYITDPRFPGRGGLWRSPVRKQPFCCFWYRNLPGREPAGAGVRLGFPLQSADALKPQ